jgi:hypothetical protein
MRHFTACNWTTAGATSSTSTIAPEHSSGPSPREAPFESMLLEHCARIRARCRCRELIVQLDLMIEGTCPQTHEKTVSRVVDELLSNSIEHGFYSRLRGRVLVHVFSRAPLGIEVSVSDDGWGFDRWPIIDGNGFHLLRQVGDLCFRAAPCPFAAKAAVTVFIPLARCKTGMGLVLGKPPLGASRFHCRAHKSDATLRHYHLVSMGPPLPAKRRTSRRREMENFDEEPDPWLAAPL